MALKTLKRNLQQVWSVYNAPVTHKQKVNYLKYLRSERGDVVDYQPPRLSLVSTGACNLKCAMCHSHSPLMPENYAYRQDKVGAIGFDLFKQVVDRYDAAWHLDIIGGGEPLLNPDLFKIADYAVYEKHMVAKTFTNGVVLDKFIDKILASGLSGITISLNGHSGEEFDRLTSQGAETWDRIVGNVRKLIAARDARRPDFLVKISFILDRVNYVHLPEMLSLARELGVDKVFLCNFLHAPIPGASAEERAIWDDHTEIVAFLRKTLNELPMDFRRKVDPPTILQRNPTAKGCRVHHEQLRVDAEGNVNSCSTMLLKMKGHGHALDDGLWNNKFFAGMRRMFNKPDAPLPEPCRVCPNNIGTPLV